MIHMLELTPQVQKRFATQLKKIYVGHAQMKRLRPTLYQLNYTENGHVQMTNSHIGIRLNSVHNQKPNDPNFPNMDNIFIVPDHTQTFTFKVSDLKPLEDHLNILYRNKVEHVKITIDSEGFKIVEEPNINSKPHETFLKSEIKLQTTLNEPHTFYLKARYLHDALMFFRQLKLPELTFHLGETPLRPINLTYKNLHYVITPVRVNKRF